MVMFCKNCGSVGAPKMRRRGSPTPELLLWLCVLVPGFVYSIWRLMNKYKTCSSCGSSNLFEFEPIQTSGTRRQSENIEKLAKR